MRNKFNFLDTFSQATDGRGWKGPLSSALHHCSHWVISPHHYRFTYILVTTPTLCHFMYISCAFPSLLGMGILLPHFGSLNLAQDSILSHFNCVLTLCLPMDHSLPGSSVHRIFPGKNTRVGGSHDVKQKVSFLLFNNESLNCLSPIFQVVQLSSGTGTGRSTENSIHHLLPILFRGEGPGAEI